MEGDSAISYIEGKTQSIGIFSVETVARRSRRSKIWDRSIGDLSHSLSLLSPRLERAQVEEKAWRTLPVTSGEGAGRRSVYPVRRSANRKVSVGVRLQRIM